MKTLLRVAAYLLVGYLLLALESPLLGTLQVRMFAPEVALAVVVWGALSLEIVPGACMAALLGLLKDGFDGGVPVGLHVEMYVLLFLACHALSRRFDYRNVVLHTAVQFVTTLTATVLLFVFCAIFDRDFEAFDMILRLALPQALITAPFGPVVGGLLSFLDRRLTAAEKEGTFR
jgi:hypothetical protein